MLSHETKIFRSALATDLQALASFFGRQKIVDNAVPLQKAAVECRLESSGGENEWSYNIERLSIPLPVGIKAHPVGVYDAQAEINVSVKGHCAPESDYHDPLIKLEAEIVVTGRCKHKENVFCSWHFDRHITEEDSAEPEAAHPRYHMHFGGRRMTKSVLDFGAILLLPGPRLPHPPLDGILFIDFVLSNFAENKWRHARTQAPYQRLIRNAQTRLWKPYVRSLHGAWAKPQPKEWAPHDVWPHFC